MTNIFLPPHWERALESMDPLHGGQLLLVVMVIYGSWSPDILPGLKHTQRSSAIRSPIPLGMMSTCSSSHERNYRISLDKIPPNIRSS